MDLKNLNDTPPWEWPKGTGELLKKTLLDRRSDTSDRLIAASLAGSLTVMDDEMAAVLLAVVDDPAEPGEMRAKAAIALGPVLEETDMEGFDEVWSEPPIRKEMFDQIQETLHRISGDEALPKELRRRSLEASVRAPQDWHTDVIRTAYSSSDKEWKLTAVFAMRWVAGFDAEIVESLKSRNPEIHLEAVRAAGARGLEAAWPHVAELLNTPRTRKDLLLAAIEAAGGFRRDDAGEILGELAGSDDEDIADAATEALLMADPNVDDDEDEDDEDEDDEEDKPTGYVN